MSTPANQVALQALEDAKRSTTESGRLFKEAREASVAFDVNQNSVNAGRRAVLAQKAYAARMNTEVGRFRAAFALLAAEEDGKAQTAAAVAAQAQSSERNRTLVLNVKHAERRRDIMLDAMQATDKAFQMAPGLPPNLVGRPASAAQATVGMTQTFRSKKFIESAGTFFPKDIRAAAGSFQGVGTVAQGDPRGSWFEQVRGHMGADLGRVRAECCAQCMRAANGDPATAAMAQRALRMASNGLQGVDLSSESSATSVSGPVTAKNWFNSPVRTIGTVLAAGWFLFFYIPRR